ncbi:MAG: NAD(P)-dependent oxidoreductase [bacterium]|nr:NAD(P)-dependent oxidoreductase [bacterium]
MSILITGGSGLVGSWVARLLAEEGEHVILYDMFERRDGFLSHVSDRIESIAGNILGLAHLNEVIRSRADLTGIVHTVALLGGDVRDNPHFATQVNVGGTHNVLEVARQAGGLRVVYVSSGAVYGKQKGPLSEDTPMIPSDPYGATKAMSEHLCHQYRDSYGVDVRCARLFFLYGPPNTPGSQAGFNTNLFSPLAGQSISLPKGRDQKGDWTYIEDAARGVVLMLKADKIEAHALNIATGIFNPVDEICEMVLKHAPGDTTIEVGPGVILERGAPLDISRARDQIGYQPRYTLEAGVKAFRAWLDTKGHSS